MTKVIAIMNQKGGVGKTTTCVNLGTALAGKSFRVLLIDLDPAGSMTSWLNGNDMDGDNGLSELLFGEVPFDKVLKKSKTLGVDYIPAGNNLRRIAANGGVDRDTLDLCLQKFSENYHFVLIDCPPSSDILIGNALIAADSILMPIQTETLPLQSGIKFLDWLEEFKSENGNSINILGILPCMFDSRTRLSGTILDSMKSSENLGPLVFNTVIRKNVRLAEIPGTGKSIFRSASKSFGASDYAMLASEVADRSGMEIPDDDYPESAMLPGEQTLQPDRIEAETITSTEEEPIYQDQGSAIEIDDDPDSREV